MSNDDNHLNREERYSIKVISDKCFSIKKAA